MIYNYIPEDTRVLIALYGMEPTFATVVAYVEQGVILNLDQEKPRHCFVPFSAMTFMEAECYAAPQQEEEETAAKG